MHRHAPLTAPLALAALVLLQACSTPPAAPAPAPAIPPAPVAAPALAAARDSAMVFALPQRGGVTAQGGRYEAFSYAEKPGDARMEKLSIDNGVARVTGVVWPQQGSTWGGIGYTATAGTEGRTVDLSARRTLRLQLASATAQQLRVRVMGADKATRDNGCYPVVMLPVSAELREHAIPLAALAPEAYCGANGRSIAATAPAVTAIEVSDPTLSAGTRHAVDFSVGRIELLP